MKAHSEKVEPTPPFPIKLLRWFCKRAYLADIEGDLLELHERRADELGKKKADQRLYRDTLLLFRPGIIRSPLTDQKLNTIAMLKHNTLLTFRNFRRHKGQFLINLTGLATGLACVLFIFLWVRDEWRMDRYHEHDQHLYQIMSNHNDASGISTWKGVPGLLLDEINETIPGVEQAVATTDVHEYTVSNEEHFLKAQGKFASASFFEVFTFPLVAGDPSSVLDDPYSIVVSRSLARRLFKTEEVIGKQVTWHLWGKSKTFQISGVMEELPGNTSEPFDFLISWRYYHDELINFKGWGNYYGRIMLVLNKDADPLQIEEKLTAILQEKQGADRVSLFLAGFSDRYLYSDYEQGQQAGGRIDYVNLFTIIAIFILSIACFNFINLSTAKAAYRTKEVGIKKTLGASRKSLVIRYFTETTILTLISLVAALLLVWFLLPQFNLVAQKQLTLGLDSSLMLGLGAFLLIVAILAGSYPALYLSRFRPIDVLKGKLQLGKRGFLSRNALVVVQFTLSIILIVAVLVIYQQMEYVQNKNLGYDRENLLYFEREGKLLDQSEAFIAELRQTPGVENATLSGFMVGGGNSTGGVDWEGKTPEDQVQFWETKAGVGLVEMLDLELVAGRAFSSDFKSDTASIIFNETAIAAMGMDDPIGKTVRHYKGDRKIIGVVKDFHLVSLHTPMEPMLFFYEPERTHFIMVKLANNQEAATIERIRNLYQDFNEGFPFKPQFVDQDYQAMYAAETRIGVLARYFAAFAILISCLGLFGLAAFAAERRTKEIGIRKILGSGVLGIVLMLMSDFTKTVVVAIIIALPISYFVSQNWLENFAFRITLDWWFFLAAGLSALLIAWLTIGYQIIKAANVNPVVYLRDE